MENVDSLAHLNMLEMEDLAVCTVTAREVPQACASGGLQVHGNHRAGRPPRYFDSVLCFGDSDWWYHNRGHADMQFMRRFAQRRPVLYVNSLGVSTASRGRSDSMLRRATRKLKSMARYLREGGEGFKVLSPIYLPGLKGATGLAADRVLGAQVQFAQRLVGLRKPLIWVACPTAARVMHLWPKAPVVYQLSDCYAALWGGSSARAASYERQIAQRANLIICSSRALLERARELYGRGEYVDHGVDFDAFFAAAQKREPLPELAGLRRPIVGFFGNLDENTVDVQLLDKLIALRPTYSFVLVGPMARGFERLRRHANVTALGQKPYSQIPRYGAVFDVCIMPWHQNEWIKHCNPVKLKEYLALGKPVVSTPFPELEVCGELCLAARGPEEFAEAIDRALESDSPERQMRRMTWAAAHTWDKKFENVLELLASRGFHVG